MAIVPDGRTPILTVFHSSLGSVTMANERAPWPFPPLTIRRVYEERVTRPSSTGPPKTIRVFRSYNGSEESIEFQATLLRADAWKLRNIARANPPEVTVGYLGETWTGVLVDVGLPPDAMSVDCDASVGPGEYIVTGTLLRNSN